MSGIWIRLFRLIMVVTGIAEAVLGLSIVFFADDLQPLLATGVLSEPLYLRIIGMMDFWIGVIYFQIGRGLDRHLQLNKATSYLRLGLSAVFLVEGVWLLEEPGLRMAYQLLAAFDFFLFVIQTLFDRTARRP